MMYSNKMVASLKANGKILREFKDTIYVPFGQEYSFLLKNLHTQRAVVNIFIDGDNIVEGGVVLDPNREVNLERYIKNGNLTEGNRFKFIERTAAIEDGPRGIKLEDGLIRIEFQYEQPKPVFNIGPKWIPGHYEYDAYLPTRNPWNTSFCGTTGISGNAGDRFSVTASGATMQANVGGALRGIDLSQNDVGITVPGSKSKQKFSTVTMGAMEAEKHTMVIKLLGETPDNKPVLKSVTVDCKPECVTCGKKNKAHANYCVECGTALEIFV